MNHQPPSSAPVHPAPTRTMRVKAVAAHTGMSETYIRRRIIDGTLQVVRVGRSVLVTVESVEAMLGLDHEARA